MQMSHLLRYHICLNEVAVVFLYLCHLYTALFRFSAFFPGEVYPSGITLPNLNRLIYINVEPKFGM